MQTNAINAQNNANNPALSTSVGGGDTRAPAYHIWMQDSTDFRIPGGRLVVTSPVRLSSDGAARLIGHVRLERGIYVCIFVHVCI